MKHLKPVPFAMLVAVLLALASVPGCTPLTPPPAPLPVNPGDPDAWRSHQTVRDYYLYRGGYINALKVATLARSTGSMKDDRAQDFEKWRSVYVLVDLTPRWLLASPLIPETEQQRAQAETLQWESQWTSLLPRS
jgi:hypothetical protein